MLDSMQIAVLSTLACFALLFVAYVKSVLGKAAKEQLQKESGISRQGSAVDDDSSNNKGGKARKVRGELCQFHSFNTEDALVRPVDVSSGHTGFRANFSLASSALLYICFVTHERSIFLEQNCCLNKRDLL